ncbi:TIR domain-containing protein [Micromonospora avicenniae]|uniref:TIR domain-containing protein n=1 Tax=Micromonospora avicenniae TaxID=1198245 RepID=A0A1N7E6J3_9ACTN|nr:TIR domain-containing protein [Micromonospora avicenniae]SIR83636.1 TIR domain-containing protein [Micromonospora avicenniae]
MVRSADKYDAFISYSHALDGKLAPVVQRELEQFAKPWYRMRAIRVFRDDANLSASSDLWASIELALASSEWFVLMASPEAARSEWVNREVAWWAANRSPDRLLIVATGGEFAWNAQTGDVDFARSTAAPPALRGLLAAEPRIINLRWLADANLADAANPRLRESIADLGSAIRGIPKDLLIGEHVRRHRQAMRQARAGIAILSTLAVCLFAASVFAIGQRNEAERNARSALAQLFAATAVAEMQVQADRAQLLAVEGYRMERNPRTRAALLEVNTASPHLVRQIPAGGRVTALAGSADGKTIVAGTEDGRLLRWRPDAGTLDEVRLGPNPIGGIAISADGATTLAIDGTVAATWTGEGDAPPSRFDVKGGYAIAASPSGRLAAVMVRSGTDSEVETTVSLYEATTGKRLHSTRPRSSWSQVGMPNERSIVLEGGTGSWEVLRTSDLSSSGYSDDPKVPAGDYVPGSSTSLGYSGYVKYRNVLVYPNGDAETDIPGAEVPVAEPEVLAIRDDGGYVAVSGGGTLWVAGTSEDAEDPTELTGSGRIEAMAFLGKTSRLVSTAGASLALWDLNQVSRLSLPFRVDVPEVANFGPPPRIAVTSDGARVAVVGGNGDQGAIHEFTTEAVRTTAIPAGRLDNVTPVWSATGEHLWLIGDGGAAQVLTSEARDAGTWPAFGEAEVLAAGVSRDGQEVVVVDDRAGVQVRRATDGSVVRDLPGAVDPVISTSGPMSAGLAAVSADGRTAAVVHAETSQSVAVIDTKSLHSKVLPGPPASAVTFGDGHLLVVRESGDLEVWDQGGESRLRTVAGDVGYARAITVVPGTGLVVRLRANGQAVIIDTNEGAVVGSVQLPPMTRGSTASPWHATAMVGAAGTGELLTATSGGSLVRWSMRDDVLLRIACDTAGRDLTTSEWESLAAVGPPEDLSCGRPSA